MCIGHSDCKQTAAQTQQPARKSTRSDASAPFTIALRGSVVSLMNEVFADTTCSKVTMRWATKGYSLLPSAPNETVHSPDFDVGQHRFRLELRPGGTVTSTMTDAKRRLAVEYFSLFLRLLSSLPVKVCTTCSSRRSLMPLAQVDCRMKVVAGDVAYNHTINHEFSSDEDWGILQFGRKLMLCDAALDNGDVVNVEATVTLVDGTMRVKQAGVCAAASAGRRSRSLVRSAELEVRCLSRCVPVIGLLLYCQRLRLNACPLL